MKVENSFPLYLSCYAALVSLAGAKEIIHGPSQVFKQHGPVPEKESIFIIIEKLTNPQKGLG